MLSSPPANPSDSTDQEVPSPVMAKRVRGSSHPAGRRPARRPSRPSGPSGPSDARPAAPGTPAATPSGALTPEEERRAAEIEARIVAEERAAEELLRRSRSRGRGAEAGRSLEPLVVRAGQEYAYVRRDVIRFVRVAAFLLGILAVLYVLINVAGVISI